jgi:hypothetical protein
LALAAVLVFLCVDDGLAQQPKPAAKAPTKAAAPAKASSKGATTAASNMADFFSQVGADISDCIFELSEEQIEVQRALIEAYIKHGATSADARRLAVKQIVPPKPSEKCEQIRDPSKSSPWESKTTTTPEKAPTAPSKAPTPPEKKAVAKAPAKVEKLDPVVTLANKQVLPQWDCASNVDFVTIKHKGYERKLTGGEICNPFEDVVRKVPDSVAPFRLGYVIKTGRLFVISDDPQANGKTIAWAISGREICRNNPDPDCLAARSIGSLPPGTYAFASDKKQRVSWGPNIKRMVVGVYLTKLWNREKYTPAQTAGILARGNIAIHVRLKGEMSEACLGLEPNGWEYVSTLVKDGRATGLNVHIDEPHPQIAEKAPIVAVSTFSLSSLFKP